MNDVTLVLLTVLWLYVIGVVECGIFVAVMVLRARTAWKREDPAEYREMLREMDLAADAFNTTRAGLLGFVVALWPYSLYVFLFKVPRR